MQVKKEIGGSNRKDKEFKDISEHVLNSNHSDSRYKASIINANTENSWRLPFEVGTREESKRSHDASFKTTYLNNLEELSEVMRQYNLDNSEVKKYLGSGARTQVTLESDNGVTGKTYWSDTL